MCNTILTPASICHINQIQLRVALSSNMIYMHVSHYTFPPKRIGNAIIYNSCKSWVFIYSRVEFFFIFGSLSNWLIKIQVPVDILPCLTLFTVIEYLRDASADYNWNIVFLVIMYSISLFLSPNSLLTLIQYRGLNTSTSGFQYMTVLVGNIFSEAGLLPETPFFIVKIIFKR